VRTRTLYFRLFGFTALAATGAYAWQLRGLAGIHGLSPIAQTIDWLQTHGAFMDAPSLCWLSGSDAMLEALCAICVASSLLLIFDVLPALALAALWLAWTSLVNVGEPFLSFQWDILLCEAAFCSIPYALWRDPPLWARMLVFLGAVKVTLESGIVKLTAGDPSWWPDLTALTYHYWTQPLPAWTSVFLDRLPLGLHQAACFIMFVIELGFPLLAFVPLRRARIVAAAGMIALQAGLAVAGNYSYFNLLAATLCVPLLDDELLARFKWPRAKEGSAPPARLNPFGWATVAIALVFSADIFGFQFGAVRLPLATAVDELRLLGSYGAFRVMTKTRPELVFEGSADGQTWQPYDFKWKPGRLDRRPQFVAPWQPRLDWQLWFSAMGRCGEPYVLNLMRHLMLGTPEVIALMGDNPFPDAPPRFIRTTLWQYRFAPTGSTDWWVRTDPEPYCPVVTLQGGNLIRAR
jgi:lipase maturation factor 1